MSDGVDRHGGLTTLLAVRRGSVSLDFAVTIDHFRTFRESCLDRGPFARRIDQIELQARLCCIHCELALSALPLSPATEDHNMSEVA